MSETDKLCDSPDRRDAEERLPREARRFLRLGIAFLLIVVGGFVFWAAWAPLDAGVPAPGVAIVESHRKTVAHLTGGIVKEIHVRDTQAVAAGMPLLMLDATTATAEYQAALKEYYAVLAARARLDAERGNARRVAFPEALVNARLDGDAARQMAAQLNLFHARRAALAGEIRVLAAASRTYEQDARSKAAQLRLLREQLDGLRALAGEGYVARNAQLDLERQVLDLEGRIDLARNQAEDARLRSSQREEDFLREVETELADAQRKLSVLAERVTNLRFELERTVIRAPVDGHVNALAIHTVGGVVRPAEPLMEVIPKDEKLIFEVKVATHLVDLVHVGLLADVQMENFHDQPGVVIEGRVISVSADLVTDRNPQLPPYYVVRVELTEQGRNTLGKRQLQPGMHVSALIKTGERSFLEYLMRPLLRGLHEAMKET